MLWTLPLHLLTVVAVQVVHVAANSQCRLVAPAHVRKASASSQSGSTSTHPASETGDHTTRKTDSGATPTQAGPSSTSSASPTAAPFNYGTTPIRGVNLGGWLVLEPWITPSIFERTGNDSIIDEYTLGQSQTQETLSMMKNHWDTWITEDDFVQIANAGLNHVRIPVGYWSVPLTSADTKYTTDPSPYIPGAWPYLVQAVDWAQKHDLHVIVDIHGAPGSQNGYDNSGQRTTKPLWALNSENVARTVDVLRYIVKELGDGVAVIQLLNEAGGWAGDEFKKAIRQYWLDGYDVVRQGGGGKAKVMIGDAFLGIDSWKGFMPYPQYEGVYMDWHMYQVFSPKELARTWDEHVSYACSLIPDLQAFSSGSMWTVVGEWSNAPTDCAKWLNGRGVGARWDGTWTDRSIYFGSCDGWSGSYSTFSDDYKRFLRRYWEAQVAVGESAIGWVYWAWKAENADEWSYQKGLEGGWIPRNPSDRVYPNICSN